MSSSITVTYRKDTDILAIVRVHPSCVPRVGDTVHIIQRAMGTVVSVTWVQGAIDPDVDIVLR